LPKGVHDLWQAAGSRKEFQYTWDCLYNKNLPLDTRHDKELKTNDNESCDLFCSDHWAIPTYCKLETKNSAALTDAPILTDLSKAVITSPSVVTIVEANDKNDQNKGLMCPLGCTKIFKNYRGLKIHYRVVHNGHEVPAEKYISKLY
jgi:hypothetical protein